ncbi:MAG: heme exporter protein CcmD [Steroidobacteraceae bacterium]
MQEWFAMGGYARYVWPSYVLGLALLGLNIRWALASAQRARAAARRRLASSDEASP